MKYTLVVISIVFFCVVGFPFSGKAENLPDGADLFIEAVRCRAGNHTLIHSLSYVTEQTYRIPTLSEDEIRKIAADMEERTRKDLKNHPKAHLWVDGTLESVREYYTQKSVLSRFTVKYKAPSFSRKLMSLQIERQGESAKKWEMDTSVIETNVIRDKSESEGVVWFVQDRLADVNDVGNYMEPLLNFGRLQGLQALFALTVFTQDTDVEKYEFSEKNIAKFKEEREKQLESGKAKTLITIGTAIYDGDAKAFVVESSVGDKIVERYWIDINRGYVCPLLQYYDKNGKLFSEYKSENYFLHEKSGLWFPELYKEMTTNREGKQEFKEYKIDKASLNVNFPIADEEFAIEIPEGAEVIDERKGKKSVRYMATSNGLLTLGEGGLDLQKKDWLASADVSVESFSTFSLVRIAIIGAGALLILYGLFGKFVRKKK